MGGFWERVNGADQRRENKAKPHTETLHSRGENRYFCSRLLSSTRRFFSFVSFLLFLAFFSQNLAVEQTPMSQNPKIQNCRDNLNLSYPAGSPRILGNAGQPTHHSAQTDRQTADRQSDWE